jgi:hypothetical protein
MFFASPQQQVATIAIGRCEVRIFTRRGIMRRLKQSLREGRAGWIILWLLGVPIPVLLALFLIRGCT